MKNKIGKIKNLIDQDTVEYFLNKYETLPKKDNGARINADTMVDQDFNKLFYDKLAKILSPYFSGTINHATVYSDYLPGGIHSDGWIATPEKTKLATTFIIPLVSEYKKNATVVFNETNEEAITYNKATGLGDKGIASYRQENLPDTGDVLDTKIQKQWLPHLDERIPFSIAEILTWEVGTAIYWPRINLHASAWFPEQTDRKAIVILTNE